MEEESDNWHFFLLFHFLGIKKVRHQIEGFFFWIPQQVEPLLVEMAGEGAQGMEPNVVASSAWIDSVQPIIHPHDLYIR